MTKALTQSLIRHQAKLAACQRCPEMLGKPVYGYPNPSPVMLIGQAPGEKEIQVNKPFAWTAGKTLFKWFSRIGLEESSIRKKVYMAAVCRCFPGKKPKGGDRVPNKEEISQCADWLQQELKLLQPQLLIPVGKLAIQQFVVVNKLDQVIGECRKIQLQQGQCDMICLPHPSGASTWHRTEPGVSLLEKALKLIKQHPAWQSIL